MMRTNKYNRRLVYAMDEMGMDQIDLAVAMGFKTSCPISQRLNGKKDWELSECYKALRILGKPIEDLHIYFPPKEDKPC